MFADRKDAGMQLAQALEAYAQRDPIVLAIPRGGAEVGYQVAKRLRADFSLLIARKLPYPDNPEAGFGAVAEDGSTCTIERATRWMRRHEVDRILQFQRAEIERRIAVLRGGRPLPDLEGRTVILVDDGIAMGSTMRAAIRLCRNRNAGHVVVAVPVTGASTAREMRELADALVVLEIPPYFRAVAQVYERWRDVSDQEVLRIMARWETDQQADSGRVAKSPDEGPE